MKYLKTYNESIMDYLKPKSEDDVKNTLDNIPEDEKLSKILENDLRYLFSDEEIKEMNDKLETTDKLYNIFEFELNDLYSHNDIKEIVNNYSDDMYDKLKLIFEDYQEYLLDGIYSHDDIKNMLLSCSNEDKLEYMDSFGIGDYYSGDEIKRIVNGIEDPYTKIDCVYVYNVKDYFTKKEIITMFNKLNDIEKNNILDHDELCDILPEDIIEKYE